MKKIKLSFILLFILHLTLFMKDCVSQWERMTGLNQTCLYSLTATGGNIIAGTLYNGIFISTDNGNTWVQTSVNNQTIWALASEENNVFAGCTNSSGVYRSTDAGITWSQTSLNNKTIYSVAVSGNKVFAGAQDNGIYFSSNLGVNWTQTSLNNRTYTGLAVFGNYVFAGLGNNAPIIGGVYISTNDGANWSLTSLDKDVWSFAKIDSNYFAGTYSNFVFKSGNGMDWNPLNNGFIGLNVWILISSGSNLIGGGSSGVFFSWDNGANWRYRNEGFSNQVSITSLAISGNNIFAGTWGNSVFRREISNLTVIQNINNNLPEEYSLFQNYPNPFNPSTNIKYVIASRMFVSLKVFDALGKEVATLVNEKQNPGTYEVTFDAVQLSSGVYFYKLISEDFSETKKMILLK